jgi:adenylate cyclase
MHAPKTLKFGAFALDLSRCLLRRGAEEIPLRPKSFDVLRYMAENVDRVVSKDELINAIWPGIFVTDDSLVQCIKDIREALNDTEHAIIKTVPRRGYLFAAEVSSDAPAAEAADASLGATADRVASGDVVGQHAEQRWRVDRPRLLLAATAALVVLGAAIGWLLMDYSATPTGEPGSTPGQPSRTSEIPAQRQSIAVLPLASLADPSGLDYFADGLTEDIISALGRFSEISVRSRNAVFPYKGKTPRPDEVGRDLDVRYVVEGSVRRTPERIRISIQLSDTSRGAVLWSEQYDAEPKDIFTVQDDITRRIAGTLAVRLNSLELARIATKPPSNLEAYDLVLRGRDLLSRATRTANSQARSMFDDAIALDPNYIPALIGLGLVDLNAVRYGWTADPIEALARAERLGHKAIAIDESNPGAHALLGRVYIRRGDLDRALDAMKRALALNSSDADSYAGLGNVLLAMGHIDGAISAIETAAQLQPSISVTDYFRLGMAYVLAGRTADAIRTLERSLIRNEREVFTNAMLAAAYAEAGRQEDAKRQAQTVRRLAPFFASSEFGSLFRNSDHRERIVAALQKAGL